MFHEKKTSFVSLGDGSTCDVTGIRTVKIKMFNGVVHTLGGVAYVPKMRRNLISLGWLDSKGCSYSAAGGAMKITCGYLVLMKGEKCGDGLYRLMGNTVICSVPLTLTGSWKQSAWNNQRWCRVFFADAAKRSGAGFQATDDGEEIPVIRDDGSRSLPRVD